MSEIGYGPVFGLGLAFAIPACHYFWVTKWKPRRQEWRGGTGPDTSFPQAAASGTLKHKFAPYAVSGSKLFFPSGDGCYSDYADMRDKSRGDDWLTTLRDWIASGVHVHVIVTIPNSRGHKIWMDFAKTVPRGNFSFISIDPLLLDSSIRNNVQALDEYHPSIAVIDDDGTNGAIWLERHHARGTDVATGVTFFAHQDLNKGTESDLRGYFSFYKMLFLLNGRSIVAKEIVDKPIASKQQAA